MAQREWMRTSGPLLILSLIEEKDRYGYEIIETLQARSNDLFSLKEGSLYPLLHRLEKTGLLTSYNEKTDNNMTRKYYRLSKEGKKELAKEKEQWKQYTKTIESVLGLAYE